MPETKYTGNVTVTLPAKLYSYNDDGTVIVAIVGRHGTVLPHTSLIVDMDQVTLPEEAMSGDSG